MASLLGLATQRLDRIGHVVRLADVCLAKGRSPREVLVHVFEKRRELRHGLYAGIPVLFVDFFCQLFSLEIGITLHPALRLDNLSRIRRGSHDLRNQSVWVQSDWRNQLLQLLRSVSRNRSL